MATCPKSNTFAYECQYENVFHKTKKGNDNTEMNKPGDILNGLLKKHSMSQGELAHKTGVPQPTISRIIRGESKDPAIQTLRKIAEYFNLNMSFFLEPQINEPQKLYDHAILRPIGIHGGRKIPVLSYIQAGNPQEAIDAYQAGAGMEYLILDDELSQEAGPHTYALIVDGESMAPDFRPGDRITIDPDIKPRPGDCVVAKMAGSQEVTFKRYRSRGNDPEGREIFELAPINQDYATLVVDNNNPGEIIGTMIEHRQKRRK